MPEAGIRIANEELAVEVSTLGAELQSIVSRDGISWLWDGDPEFWAGRAPLMFPAVGHCPGGVITIEGKTYPMQHHGFARHSRFEIIETAPDRCTLSLEASAATRRCFPFEFALDLSYRLDGAALSMTALVRNLDTRAMPFAFGFHPAFAWPERSTGPAEFELHNGREPPLIRLTPEGALDGSVRGPFRAGKAGLTSTLLDAGTLVFESASEVMRLHLGTRRIDLTVTNLPNLLVWTRPRAGFLCLEPSRGLPMRANEMATLEDRPFVTRLSSGDVRSFALTLGLVAIE